MSNKLLRGTETKLLAAVLFLYFSLSFLYISQVPLFEAPDAYFHFAVIAHLSRTGDLPAPRDVDEAMTQPPRQMAFHAPLYYLIGARLIALVGAEDFDSYRRNPHAAIGEPSARENVNFIAHVGDLLQDAGLAVRIVRVFSSVLGAVTLLGTYAFARLAVPSHRAVALWSVLFILFNPQFLFNHAVVSNDTLVSALSTLLIALTAYAVRKPIEVRYVTIVAILLALNSLAKASGLMLYVPVVLAIVYTAYRDRWHLSRLAAYGVILAAAFLLIAAWWYWRNWQLYGDPTGVTLVAAATGLRSGQPDWISEMRGLFYSFWGLFGWFNIPAPQPFYNWAIVIVGLALIGSAIGMAKNRWKTGQDDRILLLILVVFAVAYIGQWVRFNNIVQAAQGRLWFPLIALVACGLVLGLDGFRLPWLKLVMLIPLLMAAILFPVSLIRSAYQPSRQITRAAWNAPANLIGMPVRQPWEDTACLMMWVGPAKLDGDSTQAIVDVFWEGHCTVSGYWSVFLHFSDLERDVCQAGNTQHILSQYDSMPDGGKSPFPALRPGFVLADHVTVAIPLDLDWSRDWHLQLGLYDAAGTFIRAIMMPEAAVGLTESDVVSIGHCSPELVNIRLTNPQAAVTR